jgi:enoyl-CoA hydratase
MTVLRTDVSEGVAVITLARPDARNALNAALLDALDDTFRTLDANPAVRCAVITGEGKAFCAGIDLTALEQDPPALLLHHAAHTIASRRFPLIAAVNGPAITGGLELALQADFRLAGPGAVFADTHVLVGIVPGWGMSTLLTEAIGEARAREMSLTGRFVAAEEAERIGLVNRVVDGDVVAEAVAIATVIASYQSDAVGAIRGLYTAHRNARLEARQADETAAFRRIVNELTSQDVRARRDAIIARGRTLTAAPNLDR